MSVPLPHATYREIALWFLRRYRRFRVTGPSMLPCLTPGQEVLINPVAYVNSTPQRGDIVIANHPHRQNLRIIKRVDFVDSDGECYLKGDNPNASSDSRQFGLVSKNQLQGKVICLFP
ncbi:nickel-type superoxide dismutase maturation protease [Oscillatoria sp. CS-180]|uniref:nickel-type superoxide dismutase maturation protease n=1 Tax=Oscillatoria sp. CS-180 TaxID=3021720 RepID=UPI00232DA9E6|nr:nickel-type superoxide dismutase maturation protease [Oscillatoria sp. CS-180]MDB9527795.1 nickel-type superoxide dismutase maturation protease [Oscillatoria sp. CS-180]